MDCYSLVLTESKYPPRAFRESLIQLTLLKESLKLYGEVESISCPCIVSESETDDERTAYESED